MSVEGNYFRDCMCQWFCTSCTTSQEWREVMLDRYNDSNKEIWHVFTGHKDKLYVTPTCDDD